MSISRAGHILVFGPLIIVLLFVFALATLLKQADEEYARAFRAAQISNCSNKLIRDLFEIGSLTRGEVATRMSSEDYINIASTVRADLNELLETVKNDPTEVRIVQRCSQASEEALELVDHLKNIFGSENILLSLNQRDSIRLRLRSCVKRMVSRDLISMAQNEKAKSEESHLAQVRSWQQIKSVLIALVVIYITAAIFVASLFSKRITARMRILAENSFRLASGLPLRSPLGGTDEIAEVDVSFHNMATALADAKQKERSLIENSLDLICSLDRNGRFTSVNPACRQILGRSEDELLGLNLKSLLNGEDIERLERSLSEAITGNTDSKFETGIKHKEGQEIYLDWSMRWAPTEKLYFCVGHDISARKEVERLKQEFMAMIGHDLRTPLATMKSFNEMLASGLFGELTDRGHQLLSVVESNEDRMLNLVNDLLDLEKSESGKLLLERSTVKLDELLDQSVKSVAGLASRQEIDIAAAKSELVVFADPNRASQVLVNLLSNAIKFSPKNGTIKITTENKDGFAFVHISDEGRGVPEDLKEKIFERFHQVEVADAVGKGGSGLGLAICKKIVELHGGKIQVVNNASVGSTFSFSLPLSEIESSSAETAVGVGLQPKCESQS